MTPIQQIAVFSDDPAFTERWRRGLEHQLAEEANTAISILGASSNDALTGTLYHGSLQALVLHSANAPPPCCTGAA